MAGVPGLGATAVCAATMDGAHLPERLPLDGMPFSEKWALVGKQPPESEEARAMREWEDSRPLCRIASAPRLRTPPRPMSASCKASLCSGFLMSSKRSSVVTEQGSVLRMHKSRSTGCLPQRDIIPLVEEGLRQLKSRKVTTAEKTQRRRSMEYLQPIPDASQDTGGLVASASEDMDIEGVMAQDPILGEFLLFLLTAFGTLLTAYKAMDINGDGSLSSTEFMECVSGMRVRDGQRPIDHHQANVLEQIERAGGGQLRLDTLLETEPSGEPLVDRLRDYINTNHLQGETDPTERRIALEQLFAPSSLTGSAPSPCQSPSRRVTGAHQNPKGGRVGPIQILDGLARIKYEDWHWNDVFNRIDRDGSGSLSFEEMREALRPDVTQGLRNRATAHEPLGNEGRQTQLNGGFTRSGTSLKLKDFIPRCTVVPRSHEDPLMQTGFTREENGMSLRLLRRLDTIALTREAFQCKGELSRTGQHVLSGCSESLRDFFKPGLALSDFRETTPRSRLERC
eukprot:TRINITY_DN23129_c0_g2_i1.p1 TRINITY_DN23129_c0_g2~~TRINITY_DN23129_c0_g2_i1.p1  ORF type:complete len:592 (+),score=71.70 TRINITY_DN23129_c0_g2_i1:244-1776(+)